MTTSAPARTPHPRQRLLLAIAVGLIALAVVLVLVVTLRGGSSGPASGSPDAVTDQLASGLQARSAEQVAATACPGISGALARQTRGVLRDIRSAARAGSAEARGSVAVDRITLDLDQRGAPTQPLGAITQSSRPAVVATVALRRDRGASWCVAAFAVAAPTH